MAGKLVSMTAGEIREAYGKDEERIMAMARAAPEREGDLNPGGKPVARGFAQFREYINRKGRPKAARKKSPSACRRRRWRSFARSTATARCLAIS